jgi:predicted molibdopterin-dependent oxidoreductase YjgC
LVQKVVEPPGLARSDFDVLVELATKLKLVDQAQRPLIGYRTPRDAFEEWKACSKGTIPDYSGMTYEMLVERGGVQWPCNEAHPEGTPRLYTTPSFPTDPERTESYLKDLETGHAHTAREYAEIAPPGHRARLVARPYFPPGEVVSEEFPFLVTSGRLAYHWHTRTKTAKIADLDSAAPRVFIAMNHADATRLAIADGEVVRLVSRRGPVEGPVKVGDIVPPGIVFVPFHYGDSETSPNNVMGALIDPASKQPIQKHAPARIEKLDGRRDAWWSES